MEKSQIIDMFEQMNDLSGENVLPPSDEVVDSIVMSDQEQMFRYESGESFYASDECAYCQNYSGYGQVWCGECHR